MRSGASPGNATTTPAPGAATTAKPGESTHFPNACPKSASGNEQVGIYLQNVGFKRATGTPSNSPTGMANQRACQDECAKNTGSTDPDKCKSFVFNTKTKACDLFKDTIDPTMAMTTQFTADADSVYVQKVCVESAIVLPGTENALGELIPDKTLAGVAKQVLTAKDLEQCLTYCFNAPANNCTSGEWYSTSTSGNCILNSVDRFGLPAAFGPEKPDATPMFYFGRAEGTAAINSTLSFKRIARDQKPLADSWTEWSKCTNGSSGNQYTYRHQICGEKDMSLCPRQVQLCPVSACAPVLNECRAVCDWNGHRRCPHGRMLRADGSQQYCPQPVDCDEQSVQRR